MTASEAAPLVGAGMLTVLLFPAIALPLAGLTSGHHPDAFRDERDAL